MNKAGQNHAFFEHQTRARRGTARLLVLYALAVLLTVGLLVWVCSWFFPRDADRLRYALVTAVPFAAVILGASVYRLRQLSEGGGPAVALSLGGEMLQDDPTATLAERRALNVVEEMALAAGVRRSALYVLPDSSINAFAAGMGGQDAVIGLTRGAIEQLDRGELQAVVAHEFSHILNGDMRLNMRLAGYLFGLQMIAVLGQYLMSDRPTHRASGRSNSSDGSGSSGGVLIVVGLACMVLGWVGALLAGWVQAAISRQREYLADASAVQFTRQTEGLAGALYKIALSPQRRLRRRPLPEASQLDLLHYLLPLAVAAYAPADLLAAADAAYRANPRPTPTQQNLWQAVPLYLNEAMHLQAADDAAEAEEASATVMWQADWQG